MMMIQEPLEQKDMNCSDPLCRLNGWVGGGIGSWVGRRDERLDGRKGGYVGG
jgi:hypothetical protein